MCALPMCCRGGNDDVTINRPRLCLLLTVGLFFPPALAEPAESLGDLTGHWRLFVDDHWIADKTNVKRAYHAFKKHPANPVMVADKPWEGATAYLYGTVLPAETGNGYRMWYHSWDGEYRILYAASPDGTKWHKPDLGLVEYKGSRKNNILLRRTHEDHIPQVIHTPWETDPNRQYKLINFDYGRTPPKHTVTGYWGAYSPDGIHWTDTAKNPVFPDHPGDVGCFVWDPRAKRYTGYPKTFADVRGFRRRSTGYTATTSFEKWPPNRLIMVPDEYDDRWVEKPGQHTDFYGLSGFAYESMYIGFLWIFRITDGKNDGPIFVELVTSHDGVDWRRQEEPRPPILPLAPDGAWDDGMLFTPNHPLVEGDTIRLYYGGFDVTHGFRGSAAVGLATLRKDGFASLDAGQNTGTVTTRKTTSSRSQLRVNYRTADGWVKVELLDETGNTIPGYTSRDCNPLTGDNTNQTVSWKDTKTLPAQTKPIQIRFILKNASLYAFNTDPS